MIFERQAAIDAHNRKTNVKAINFDVGDFVLRGLLQRETGRKPSLRWKGLYRVISCTGDYIFRVEDLLSGERLEVHGRRLKFFRNKDYEVTEQLMNHLSYQTGELSDSSRVERSKDVGGCCEPSNQSIKLEIRSAGPCASCGIVGCDGVSDVDFDQCLYRGR